MSDIVIRDLSGLTEFQAAEALQRTVWGDGDKEDPADLMMVIQHEGGLVAGAFQGEQLAGYIFGFPTREPAVQHSHRLAVVPSQRGSGLALRLKRYQRQWCLQRGIKQVRWTFDPLRVTNAHLNVGRLGAVVRSYLVDYYGVMAGINAGLPSDRLLAEWLLDDARVVALASDRNPLPLEDIRSVMLPHDIDGLLASAPAAALSERMRVRAELTVLLSDGYEIRGLDRAGPAYLLTRR